MRTTAFFSAFVLVLFLAGTTATAQPGLTRPPSKHNAAGSARQGICLLYPTEGYGITGKITFVEIIGGVRVTGLITGLAPLSKHGIHIHEYGDCSAADASSAGGHFNPANTPHGGQEDPVRHAGDLGNLEADLNGTASFDFVDPVLTLRGEASVIGLSVIVHQNEDDLKSQPSGNAGARIACGVIGLAK